jgi:hypothetical protein
MFEDQKRNVVVMETDAFIDICVGVSGWQKLDGRFIIEDDFRVAGEIWRVHKSDADPYPSNPHAHCVDGAKRFIGCTLHLGTRELFRGRRALGRYLHEKQFDMLLDAVRPKFPGVTFPLAV